MGTCYTAVKRTEFLPVVTSQYGAILHALMFQIVVETESKLPWEKEGLCSGNLHVVLCSDPIYVTRSPYLNCLNERS